MMAKRVRTCLDFMGLPLDIHCAISLFVVDSWSALDNLRLVCKLMQRAMGQPLMVQHIKVDVFYPRDFANFDNSLSGIRTLQLHTLHTITSCPFDKMPSLHTLNVSGCYNLTAVKQLGDIPQVTALDLSFCSNFTNLEGLSPNVKTLDLTINGVVSDDLQPVALLRGLEELCLSFCNVTHLRPLSELLNMQRLDLGGCGDVDDQSLWDLCHLTNLQELNLMNCVKVRHVDALENLSSLGTLNLTNCHVSNIQPLANLRSLQTLNLSNCSRLRQLCLMPQLITLNLNYCQAAELDVVTLSRLSSLQELHLAGACLPPLNLLEPLAELRTLHMSTFYRLEDEQLYSLHKLSNLTHLDLFECENVTRKGILKLKTALPSLHVGGYHFCGFAKN